LSDLERKSGIVFHEKLDRSTTESLCEVNGCQIQGYREFQSYYIKRGIQGSYNERELERHWKKAKVIDFWF
jgi:hypothetical protein